MNLGTLENSTLDECLGPRFAAGLQWLAHLPAHLPDGRIDLDGDNLYALVQSYETAPPSGKYFESHRTYADIQFMLDGSELIYYAPVSGLCPLDDYNAEKDVLLYADPAASTALHFPRGTLAIFHPHDGHKPGCANGASSFVRKIVIKVRL